MKVTSLRIKKKLSKDLAHDTERWFYSSSKLHQKLSIDELLSRSHFRAKKRRKGQRYAKLLKISDIKSYGLMIANSIFFGHSFLAYNGFLPSRRHSCIDFHDDVVLNLHYI